MNRTNIAWTTFTANPIRARNRATGAVGHVCVMVSAECLHCYAADWNATCRPAGDRLLGTGLPYALSTLDKVDVFLDEGVLADVRRRKKPATIFWCSMTDIAGDFVPDAFIDAILAVIDDKPGFVHQVLTKRPGRLRDHLARRYAGRALPPQLWVGVTAGVQRSADERIPVLREIPAAVRFLSVEPLLEPVWLDLSGIHWVIVGGESTTRKHAARACEVRWLRHVVGQCRAAGVPCFVKQLGDNCRLDGEPLKLGRKGGEPERWPEALADLRVRQWPASAAGATS